MHVSNYIKGFYIDTISEKYFMCAEGSILMRNSEERLMKMHKRAAELKRRREKAGIRILGTVSAGLTVCLILIMQQTQGLHHELMSSQNTGSSLLSSSVGGYILVALAAFFAGVIVTVVIIRYRKRE